MSDIATQIKHMAELAEAPKRDFRPWHSGKVIQHAWQAGVEVPVLSYAVPAGYGLIVTRVDSWVSTAYNTAATPGAPHAVEEIIAWPPGFSALWISDADVVAGRFSNYLALAKSDQLIVFQSGTTAKFSMSYSGTNQVAQEQSFGFLFFGFLTLPEHAERLIKNQSVTV